MVRFWFQSSHQVHKEEALISLPLTTGQLCHKIFNSPDAYKAQRCVKSGTSYYAAISSSLAFFPAFTYSECVKYVL